MLAGILLMAWMAVKNVHDAESDIDGLRDYERRAVCDSSERIATVA